MKSKLLFIGAGLALLISPSASIGQVPLGTAAQFALFTATGAFNGDVATIVTGGDIGTNLGAFTPTTLTPPAVSHVTDAVSAQAAMDVFTAYNALGALGCGAALGAGLGPGQTLTPNVYCTVGAAALTGNLTLDGQGDPNAVFILKINGALATAALSSVTLINGAQQCNVYWQINGAFVMGVNTTFEGSVIANGQISLGFGAALNGRGLVTVGAISTNTSTVNLSSCAPPSITCPLAVGVSCTNQVPLPNVNSVGVTVTCAGTFTVTSLGDVISNQTCPDRYSIVRTYRVTDFCGVTADCAQAITVNDQTPPTITCPPNLILACTDPTPPADPATVVTSDNCGGLVTVILVNQYIAFLAAANRVEITRFYCAMDVCGNSKGCAQSILKL